MRRPVIAEVVSGLQRALTIRQNREDVPHIGVEANTTFGSVISKASFSIIGKFRRTRPTTSRPTPRKVRQYRKLCKTPPSSRFAPDCSHSIRTGDPGAPHNNWIGETDGSAYAHDTPSGLCGLLQSATLWQSGRWTPPPRNPHPNDLPEKVLMTDAHEDVSGSDYCGACRYLPEVLNPCFFGSRDKSPSQRLSRALPFPCPDALVYNCY